MGKARPPAPPTVAAPNRRRLLFMVLALGAVAIAITAVLWHRRASTSAPPADPTRVGPERTLVVDGFRIDAVPSGGYRLTGSGKTNLPDGALVRVEVLTTDVVASAVATVASGGLAIDARDARLVTNGTYRVFATFKIEEQPLAVREALVYQPRRLQATAALTVASGVAVEAGLRPELVALIQRAHATNGGKAELKALAREAEAFERRLWISTLLPSVRRLRTAVAAALESAAPDLAKLRRGALEAEALSSL